MISAIIWADGAPWYRYEFIWERPLINGCIEVYERVLDLSTFDVDNSKIFVDKNWTVKNPTKFYELSTRERLKDCAKEVGFIIPKGDL